MPSSVDSWHYAMECFLVPSLSCVEVRVYVTPPGAVSEWEVQVFAHRVTEEFLVSQAEYAYGYMAHIMVNAIRTKMNTPGDFNEVLRLGIIKTLTGGPITGFITPEYLPAEPDTHYKDTATSEFEGVEDLDESLWEGSDGFA